VKIFPLFFFSLSISTVLCFAQEDSSFSPADTVVAEDEDEDEFVDEDELNYIASPDSSVIEKRSFREADVGRLKADPEMDYKQPPTVAESLWDRFWAWVGQILESMFDAATTTNWGRLIVYAVGLALLVVLIMLILKVNAFKVLYSAAGGPQKYQLFDENIHQMDFDKLIREAIDQQDYRRGVRLLFLYALKLLSDKQLIHFESGKTNHDYVMELEQSELKTGLNELSFYFDYAWYGNFRINHETFNKAQQTFSAWKIKIR
jgi:hypothetical protein